MSAHAALDVRATRVFARVVPAIGERQGRQHWKEGQPAGTPWESLLEGQCFDRLGRLHCVDIPSGRILRFDRRGGYETVAEYDGWPNGLKFHRDGRAFVTDYRHGILEFSPDFKEHRVVLRGWRSESFKGVNDLFFSQDGSLYFTDQGLTGHQDPSGRLFRLRKDGRLDCLLDRIPSPNGLVMNLDESAIYLAATRANAVWRVPLMPDGTVAKVGTFVQLSGGTGPDGLALDCDGGLLIAHTGFGCVWVTDRKGELIRRINSCVDLHTTNLAFGGPHRTQLFITESGSGSLLCVDLPTAGEPMFGGQPSLA